jgi:hypothetical protein
MLPLAASPRPVECVNCSDDASIILAAGAFMVGLFALFLAARQYAMNAREHAEFNRKLSARSRLTLRLRMPDAEDGVTVLNQHGEVAGLLEVGIANEGDKAAEWATVNALFPDWIHPLYWCDPEKRHPDGPDARPDTGHR